ncbi:hypothetical protein ACZ90_15620 [Streptomyces albus subsp. albus]|nr:hypothetical protein ACZ90_15620 [Streptomyces albus subsp. albus]
MTLANATRAAAAGLFATALIALAGPAAHAADAPTAPERPADGAAGAAHRAAAAPATLNTLSRFFARDGKATERAAAPRIEGGSVPVYTLSPVFVAAAPQAAGVTRTPIAQLEFFASKAVAADGRQASVWTVPDGRSWQVVNIATGADETVYAAKGAKKLAGGTVFREPQIDAWYVQRGDRVLPLDPDATRAIGAAGTTVRAYQKRVHQAYGDKLPDSAYARKGLAGGFDAAHPRAQAQPQAQDRSRAATAARAQAAGGDNLLNTGSVLAGAGTLTALALGGAAALRARRG